MTLEKGPFLSRRKNVTTFQNFWHFNLETTSDDFSSISEQRFMQFWPLSRSRNCKTETLCRSPYLLICNKTRKKANISKHVTLHGLRHSFATHMIEKGVPLHVVQNLLGHHSIKTTEIYLHISNKFRKELRSPLDDMDL